MSALSRSRHCRQLKDIMARTSIAFVLLAIVVSAKTYEHRPEEGVTFYTFSCNNKNGTTRWCGVDQGRWKSNRILYYNYTVRDEITIKNITDVTHINNCTGATSSDGCRVVEIDQKKNVSKVREKTITRGAEPYKIVELSNSRDQQLSDSSDQLTLGLIHTDNFNSSGDLVSDTYPLLQDKHWQLNIRKGCRMKIIFREFDLESSPGCEKDYFSIQTSKNQNDIHKYCHNVNEIEIRRRRRVQLTMHSDEAIARKGVHATLCISNLPEQTDINQEPCTCKQVSRRSARRARAERSPHHHEEESTDVTSAVNYRQLQRKRILEEDKFISEWLRTMMSEGQTAIDRFIKNPVNNKQKMLAEKYQQALQRADEERTLSQ